MAVVLHGDQSSLFVATGKARWNVRVAVAHLVIPLAALAAVRPDTPLGAALVWSAQCVLVPPVLAFVVLRELRSVQWDHKHSHFWQWSEGREELKSAKTQRSENTTPGVIPAKVLVRSNQTRTGVRTRSSFAVRSLFRPVFTHVLR